MDLILRRQIIGVLANLRRKLSNMAAESYETYAEYNNEREIQCARTVYENNGLEWAIMFTVNPFQLDLDNDKERYDRIRFLPSTFLQISTDEKEIAKLNDLRKAFFELDTRFQAEPPSQTHDSLMEYKRKEEKMAKMYAEFLECFAKHFRLHRNMWYRASLVEFGNFLCHSNKFKPLPGTSYVLIHQYAQGTRNHFLDFVRSLEEEDEDES